MTQVFPVYTESQLQRVESPAERRVYLALKSQLTGKTKAIHGVSWLLKCHSDKPVEGELDFAVYDPDFGILVIEVKGGGVSYDAQTRRWTSLDRFGMRHEIHDPFRQARKGKFDIRAKLRTLSSWPRNAEPRFAHAVIFADLNRRGTLAVCAAYRLEAAPAIVGSGEDVEKIAAWLSGVFTFWRGKETVPSFSPQSVNIFEELALKSFEVKPLLSHTLHVEETQHIRLTNEQYRILDILKNHLRASIAGGAGTGKTLIAAEKARRLASSGLEVLMVCYSRPLAEFLKNAVPAAGNLDVCSFHELCQQQINKVKAEHGRDLLAEAEKSYPGQDKFEVQLPWALCNCRDLGGKRYGAVVVDEAQDFRDAYWLAIEQVLVDAKSSPAYIFFDNNQNLYKTGNNFPLTGLGGGEESFTLTMNCRNTMAIHEMAYAHFQGPNTFAPDIPGEPVRRILSETVSAQAVALTAEIRRLIADENISPKNIVILVEDESEKKPRYEVLRLLGLPLTTEPLSEQACIRFESVKRFKGLEAQIVCLWLRQSVSPAPETIYVGMTRAKSILYLVGTPAACDAIVRK